MSCVRKSLIKFGRKQNCYYSTLGGENDAVQLKERKGQRRDTLKKCGTKNKSLKAMLKKGAFRHLTWGGGGGERYLDHPFEDKYLPGVSGRSCHWSNPCNPKIRCVRYSYAIRLMIGSALPENQ